MTIVELGTLTKAAEKLNMTQSSVSYAISSLEAELGFALFKRSRVGMRLTANGERILKYIKKILDDEKLLRQEAAAISSADSGTVSIGTLSSVSSNWLPGVLAYFNKKYPLIEVKTYLGCYDEISSWIYEGTVDFGFVSLPISKPFETIALKKDNLVVVLPPDHPLKECERITYAQLDGQPFIMPQWGNDDDVKRILYENRVKPQIKYELMEERTILAMVQMGMGVSILPELILANAPENIHIVELERPEYRTIGIAAISLKHMSPAAKKLLNSIRVWLKKQDKLEC